jgi:hypothetical protein
MTYAGNAIHHLRSLGTILQPDSPNLYGKDYAQLYWICHLQEACVGVVAQGNAPHPLHGIPTTIVSKDDPINRSVRTPMSSRSDV